VPIEQCRECGRLVAYLARGLCPDCHESRDRDFVTVRESLRDEPARTVDELAKRTGVSRERIIGFVSEGRLELGRLEEARLTCEACGRPSDAGRLCSGCRDRLGAALDRVAQPTASAPAPSGLYTRKPGR
jgi:predicted amidophosphoribosyltransferase